MYREPFNVEIVPADAFDEGAALSLDAVAAGLAHGLTGRHVGPDDRLAQCVKRNIRSFMENALFQYRWFSIYFSILFINCLSPNLDVCRDHYIRFVHI